MLTHTKESEGFILAFRQRQLIIVTFSSSFFSPLSLLHFSTSSYCLQKKLENAFHIILEYLNVIQCTLSRYESSQIAFKKCFETSYLHFNI